MTEILIGLGQLLSVDPENLAGDLPATSVRVAGIETALASGDDFRVWGALSRAPQPLEALCDRFFVGDHPGRDEGTRSQRPADRVEVAEVVERLRGDGLVVGVTEGAAHLELALRIRILPLWRANAGELAASDRFPIGSATTTVLTLTARQHDVWSSLDERNRIVDVAVGDALRAGDDDVEKHLPVAWAECIDLVRLGAAYFDVAIS